MLGTVYASNSAIALPAAARSEALPLEAGAQDGEGLFEQSGRFGCAVIGAFARPLEQHRGKPRSHERHEIVYLPQLATGIEVYAVHGAPRAGDPRLYGMEPEIQRRKIFEEGAVLVPVPEYGIQIVTGVGKGASLDNVVAYSSPETSAELLHSEDQGVRGGFEMSVERPSGHLGLFGKRAYGKASPRARSRRLKRCLGQFLLCARCHSSPFGEQFRAPCTLHGIYMLYIMSQM